MKKTTLLLSAVFAEALLTVMLSTGGLVVAADADSSDLSEDAVLYAQADIESTEVSEEPAEATETSEDEADDAGETEEDTSEEPEDITVQSFSGIWSFTKQLTWEYEWLPNGFVAYCEETGESPCVMLEEGTYSYCPENIPETFSWIQDIGWSDNENFGISAYSTVYRVDGSSDEFQYGFPTEIGTYEVALALSPGIETDPDYWLMLDMPGIVSVTVSITHTAGGTWTADGNALVTNCAENGEVLAKVYLPEDVTEYLCEENPDSYINTWYLDDNAKAVTDPTKPDIVTLYQGKGKTKYTLSTTKPTKAGTYEMYLAVLSDPSKPKSATLKTEPQTLTILEHEWEYSTDEYSLYAECGCCGANASVTIDTSTVYDASRNYNGDTLDYEVFYEENWSSQEGIEPYNVLFSGYQTFETSTTVYDRAFVKPDSTGSYSVRLALLEDPDDPETAFVSTKEKPYYLADIGIGECQVTNYGYEQIVQFTEPDTKAGVYQVGTLSELLWCVYNDNQMSFIQLTNDIVVNPITVNDKGETRCGSYQIYTWDGFGTDKNPFLGCIIGNGYTIYGIYQTSGTAKYSGLIDYCSDAVVTDLTVENSVFYGVNVGAIAGGYDCTSNGIVIEDCHALNCYLSGENTAGSIAGLVTSSTGSTLDIQSCSSNSIICGGTKYGAGGIVGKADGIDALNIQDCYNLGEITSTEGYAGGILGYGNLGTNDAFLTIYDCFNTGSINCPNYVGGIAGYVVDYKDNMRLFFDNCTSTGYLYYSDNLGGITGYIDTDMMYYYRSTVLGNFFYNASVGFNGGSDSINQQATKLTRSQYNGGFVCSKYGHTECSHWTAVSSPSCTSDGELRLSCAVCDAVMESELIAAHGHRYEYGECIFCGAYEDDEDLEGSMFGSTPIGFTTAAAGTLLLLAGVGYGVKRKKSKKG